MIGIPMNPISIHVSWVRTGCCNGEFDTTYPIHLNGIISQNEYRESIERINRAWGSNKALIFMPILFFVIVTISIILFIAGGLNASRSSNPHFPVMTGVAMGVLFIGMFVFIAGMMIVSFRKQSRIRQVVSEESMKYSTRSPTPCSWRLETARYYVGGYGNNNAATTYYIVIDIGRASTTFSGAYYGTQGVNASSQLLGQQNNYAPPPPYSNASNGYCSQCSAIRTDISARFCSSCGQPFNKY